MPAAIAKAFSKFKEYGIFIVLAVYFAMCYFLISRFDSSYTITPQENGEERTVSQVQASENDTSLMQTGLSAQSEEKESSAASEIDENDIPYITDTRTVKEYHGGLGIYNCFDELLGSFDIDLSILPSANREALKEGIIFDSDGEMQDFLESLDS